MAPLVILVEFVVKLDFSESFAELVTTNARCSIEQEPGCRCFDVLRVPDDPRCFWLYEIYDDDAAFDGHLQAQHFKTFATAIDGQVETHRHWRLGFHNDSPAPRETRARTQSDAKDDAIGDC
jgi:autoinducer 2-degrading protein